MTGAALSASAARRIALAAQGFDRPRPRRVDARHLRRTIQQLGLLQIDFVNVLVPAHHLVPFSRLGPYDRERLHALVYRQGQFTEQWAHEACILPMETWPLLAYRMAGRRMWHPRLEEMMAGLPGFAERVLETVRVQGPVCADELERPDGMPRRVGDAWKRSVPRIVLDGHFACGRLAVADRREDMARTYDLVERVIPAEHLERRVEREDAQRELLLLAARSHGVGTAGDLADYYRIRPRNARPLLAELVEEGALHAVRVEGWREPAYLHPEAERPRRVRARALLSPFDPVVWHRPRAERLFGFHYRIEIYVPAAKRRWGYYVLPFLLGDRLVARVDLKADRSRRRLAVPAAHLEQGADAEQVADALAAELQTLATWLDLETVSVGRRGPFARPLAAAVRRST